MKTEIAIVVSALFFGLFHLNVVQGLYAFIIGLLLAYVYEKYKSIWAPILFHVAANSVSIFLTEVIEEQSFFNNAVVFSLITIVFLCVTIVLTMWMRRHVNPKEIRLDRSVLENV